MALVILSGQTHSGKRQIAEQLILNSEYGKVITTTTRPKRFGEIEGLDHNFVDAETFNSMKEKGAFLESEVILGEQYGLTFAALLSTLENNPNAVVTLSPDGTKKLRNYLAANKMPYLACFIDGDTASIVRKFKDEYAKNSLSGNDFVEKMVNYIQLEKTWSETLKKQSCFDVFFEMKDDKEEDINFISNVIDTHVSRLNNLSSKFFG